jgi:hypothetical protein
MTGAARGIAAVAGDLIVPVIETGIAGANDRTPRKPRNACRKLR